MSSSELKCWAKHIRGVKNNYPDVHAEWVIPSKKEQRLHFDEAFGSEVGWKFRAAGFGTMMYGPKTRECIDRTLTRLGKALYWSYIGKINDGTVFFTSVSGRRTEDNLKTWDLLARITPVMEEFIRTSRDVCDQFSFRYNASSHLGIFAATVYFSEQHIYFIIAGDQRWIEMLTAEKLREGVRDA